MGRPRKQPEPGRTIYVANESFATDIDGVPQSFNRDHTRVSAEWLDAHPQIRHLFTPISVHYDIEAATADPGEAR